MIRLNQLRKSYSTDYTSLEVLKGIDLSIDPGEFVSIMGSSGSGKSTLLNILGILDEYDNGEYVLDNTLIKDLSQKQAAHLRNQFIGFVFQSFNLLPFKTAKENVALPLYYQKVDRTKRQELSAAINNLQLLREGASRNSKQVANIVVSTVDGMVLDIPIEEGSSVIERNNFNEGTSIAVVADMNSLIFEGKVDESDVGKLKEGMPLELTVGAIEDATFAATLEYIAPKGENEDGTVKFEVRAAIRPENDIFLRAGYSANADIILDKRTNVVSVKERDILFEEDTTFVEIKVGDRKFEKKEVQLGLSDGIQVEIVNGIDTSNQIKVIKPS